MISLKSIDSNILNKAVVLGIKFNVTNDANGFHVTATYDTKQERTDEKSFFSLTTKLLRSSESNPTVAEESIAALTRWVEGLIEMMEKFGKFDYKTYYGLNK